MLFVPVCVTITNTQLNLFSQKCFKKSLTICIILYLCIIKLFQFSALASTPNPYQIESNNVYFFAFTLMVMKLSTL